MWVCKECGKEIKYIRSEARMYSMDKNENINLLKYESNVFISKFVCGCGERENSQLELKDIAKWVDDQ